MFDLTIKDKPRSAFGKLKDRVTGRKRGDMESSSAILPGRYAALSGATGQQFGEEGEGAPDPPNTETPEKKSTMKDFFKGRLRKSSDTQSCSSLGSDSSVFSVLGDKPPPSLDLLSDPPSSPVYSSKVRMDTLYGDSDLAKKGEIQTLVSVCRISPLCGTRDSQTAATPTHTVYTSLNAQEGHNVAALC